mgnify:CR=1 FL=1
MTLYYEDVPADDNDAPQLPPLLKAVAVASSYDVHDKAIALAASSDVGTVFYSEAVDRMYIAVVLSPEVTLADAGQMLFAMMIAAGDAIGALAPPEVAVSYQMPGYILLNKGRAGVVRVAVDPAACDRSVPDWMVVSAEVMLTTHDVGEESWQQSNEYEHTSLAEEGGGHISRTRLVESCSRHFLVWVNRWQDDGFRPLFDAWMHRLETSLQVVFEATSGVEWLGLDETGAMLVKMDGKPVSIPPHELEAVCGKPTLVETHA